MDRTAFQGFGLVQCGAHIGILHLLHSTLLCLPASFGCLPTHQPAMCFPPRPSLHNEPLIGSSVGFPLRSSFEWTITWRSQRRHARSSQWLGDHTEKVGPSSTHSPNIFFPLLLIGFSSCPTRADFTQFHVCYRLA